MTLQKVSHSEAESFLSCRRKHFYGYVKNGGLKPNVSAAAPLFTGPPPTLSPGRMPGVLDDMRKSRRHLFPYLQQKSFLPPL